MKALVISGGGSKGAFAGGVAQYLIQNENIDYDLYLGTSTGSLLVPHLALNRIAKIKHCYTSVSQNDIFSSCPFRVKKKGGLTNVAIHHKNVLMNFYRGSKTFGESKNLRKLIQKNLTRAEFDELKYGNKEVIITVSNLSKNTVEYKSVNDFDYEDFCDWIWISCNYPPFMSLVKKNNYEYADGGLGAMVPIEEALNRGATQVDVVVLETEMNYLNRLPSNNPFSLLTNIYAYMLDRIEHQNIRIGKYEANLKNATLRFFYTPTVLTTNSFIFDNEKMKQWWEIGFNYAKNKSKDNQEI